MPRAAASSAAANAASDTAAAEIGPSTSYVAVPLMTAQRIP
jgi:hypothetical protein